LADGPARAGENAKADIHEKRIERAADVTVNLIACVLLIACAAQPPGLNELPELPAEFAQDLAVAHTAPVLMTKPARAVLQPPSLPPPPVPARACTTVYDGYVVYPIAVCYPPGELYGTLELGRAEAPPPARAAISPPQRFKLSAHPLVRIGLPWYCTVRGGPWYAHVDGAQLCNANPNNRSWTAEISGAPEPVVVTWSGALTDVPPPLQLAAISETGEFCTCCSGFTCPNGSCAAGPQLCGGGGSPAVTPRR
jgi:hypothetical protein